MARILDDTTNAAKTMMDSARENAGHAVEGAEHAVASTRSAVFDGVRTVTGLIAMLRRLDGDDALGWIGLARRRSPLHTVAAFGAGMAVGAGVAMMLAPMSGRELRAMVLDQLRGAMGRASKSADGVATTAPEAENKVEARPGDGPMPPRQQQPNRSASRQPS